MIFLIFEFIAFPKRDDALLVAQKTHDWSDISVESSGSHGLFYNGKCYQTYPNETLNDDEKQDWCSSIPENRENKPFIQYSIKNKAMKLTGYSIRTGCCHFACCCINDGKVLDEICCCALYSFSLLGSNDNLTWTTLHKVEKDDNIWVCKSITYSFDETSAYRFVRFVLDEVPKGCNFCLQLNQIQLYGETENVGEYSSSIDLSDDESVSIIGRVEREE